MKKIISGATAVALAVAGVLIAVPLTASATVLEVEPTAEVCYGPGTDTVYDWELQRIDWLRTDTIVDEEAVEPVAPSIAAGWYTEADDTAPVATDSGIVFTADGAKATGLRTGTNYPFAEASGQSYTAYFHDRLVIDVVGEPYGPANWRNDYSSVTFIDGGVYVNLPGSGWQSTTLGAVQALFPDAVVTSRGYHMDSNAPAGTTATITEAWVAGTPGKDAVTHTEEVYSDWYTIESGVGAEVEPTLTYEQESAGTFRYVVTPREVEVEVEVECLPEPVVLVSEWTLETAATCENPTETWVRTTTTTPYIRDEAGQPILGEPTVEYDRDHYTLSDEEIADLELCPVVIEPTPTPTPEPTPAVSAPTPTPTVSAAPTGALAETGGTSPLPIIGGAMLAALLGVVAVVGARLRRR